MTERRFRIVNVFTVAGEPLTGNPLCVFEDARGLADAELQALARQLNLSETTFVLPPTAGGDAHVRIFTPSYEMPFAGHPTLGTANVVRDLLGAGQRLALEMAVGRVEATFESGLWTLRAARAPETRVPDAPAEALAKMLGLPAIGERPLWVDTGAEQLVIPLRSAADVAAARPNAELLAAHCYSARRGAHMAYVWARQGPARIAARFFFLSNGGIVEDPATGSACANLGGWFLATGAPLPVTEEIDQGAAVSRPSRLRLHVDEQRQIFVSGEVIEVGRGSFFV